MEFMASLQSGLDPQKPSLFEILSEQQLSALIPPSLRYLLALATHRHPRYLIRILNSFDEVYALLSLLVERHYLRTYAGGFTENFYGLKRERVLRVRHGEVPRAALGAPAEVRDALRLTEADVWKNLAVMVGIPYLKRKLDEAYDVHAAHADLLVTGPQFQQRPQQRGVRATMMHYYRWFLRHVYPSVNAAFYFSMLAFNLSYLFDGTKFHSPFLYLIGSRVRRMAAADHAAIDLALRPAPSSRPARPGETRSIFSPRAFTHTVWPRLLASLKILLPTSIFALKFLEWWHASDFARQLARRAHETLELPAPAVAGLAGPASKAKQGDDNAGVEFRSPPVAASTLLPILTVPPAYSSELCPICLAPIVTPTASQTGFVYCYKCIHQWVDGTHARQEAFMAGKDGGGAWAGSEESGEGGSRVGEWESGLGRDAVTGRRVLGGSGGLRRVMV